jgi:hypothetical protein
VKKMLQAACDASGASHVVGEVTFPLSGPEQLLEVAAASLPQGAKLAVFDAGGFALAAGVAWCHKLRG